MRQQRHRFASRAAVDPVQQSVEPAAGVLNIVPKFHSGEHHVKCRSEHRCFVLLKLRATEPLQEAAHRAVCVQLWWKMQINSQLIQKRRFVAEERERC